MKIRKDVITKEDFDNYKKEQQLLVDKLNNKVELLNKKNKKVILFVMLICLFVSGISSVLSYSLGANSVEYTPRDSNWNVSNAQEAIDNLFDSVGSALVGSIYSYMGVITPPGYLACDGSTYNIDDYPRLANHINVNFGSVNYFGGDGDTTFAVPNLQGEFLRGAGANIRTNQGSGANVGVHQDATITDLPVGYSDRTIGVLSSNLNKGFYNSSDLNLDSIATSDGYMLVVGGSKYGPYSNLASYTSRPTNTSVLYIIKY